MRRRAWPVDWDAAHAATAKALQGLATLPVGEEIQKAARGMIEQLGLYRSGFLGVAEQALKGEFADAATTKR